MLLSILLLFAGLGMLIFGADTLVKGAASISKTLGIPQIVIGLTIVAFGTSAPELVINLFSAYKGTTDLAIGNIVGSNIGNILLILGITLLISDLKVKKNTTWKEIPFAILAALVLYILASDISLNETTQDIVTKADGFILLCFFIIFLYYIFALSLANKNEESSEQIKEYKLLHSIGFVIAGLTLLFFGGKLLVEQAIYLARLAHVSEMLIGLTIVAIGTSLPELVTSVVAVRKGQTDMVIGNIIGSNIFNTFWILGLTSTVAPLKVSPQAYIDIQFSLVSALCIFLFLFMEKQLYREGRWLKRVFSSDVYILKRWQGAILVLAYISYIVYLVDRG